MANHQVDPPLTNVDSFVPRSDDVSPTKYPQETAFVPVRHDRLLGYRNPYPPDDLSGKDVQVNGLVRSIRKQKHRAFAGISDGTTLIPLQACLTPEQAKNLTNGCYVELVGRWQESPGKGQSHELAVSEVKYIGESNAEENPIQKQDMSVEFLRTIPHLRIRKSALSLVARVRSNLVGSAHLFFSAGGENPATYVHTPVVTSSDCEGAGEVFTISPHIATGSASKALGPDSQQESSYFGSPKYLTVSSQLHLEAFSAELGDVWTLAPTFRAEPSDTPRHLSEFYMLEAEYRGLRSLGALTARTQQLIRFLTERLLADQTGEELATQREDSTSDIRERWKALLGPWETRTYTEVMSELIKANQNQGGHLFVNEPGWGNGLQLEHEKWLVKNIAENRPLFVTDYPAAVKPFYMLPSNVGSGGHGRTVACFDLLLPFGYCEVVGGSLREHRLDKLIENMRNKQILRLESIERLDKPSTYPYLKPGETMGDLQWYADIRRFGNSPHGGFGLGFDRLLAYLTGFQSIRDVVGFPRYYGRADC